MNVWAYIAVFAVGTTVLILGLSALVNFVVITFAHRNAGKTMDRYIAKLEKLLPGKNCGACGCEDCAAYAREMFSCRKETDCCTQGDEQLASRLSECMDEFQRVLDGEKIR